MAKELIDFRITSIFISKEEGNRENKEDFYFGEYEGELNLGSEKNPRWNYSEWIKIVGGGKTVAIVSGETLEGIASGILNFEKYARLKNPEYKVRLWEGRYPFEKKRSCAFTEKPKESVVEELPKIFGEYYKIMRLIREKKYEEAYQKFVKSNVCIQNVFSYNLEDELLIQFYNELCGINRKEAERMAKIWYPHLYSELETEYLHYTEGKCAKRKLKGHRGRIYI